MPRRRRWAIIDIDNACVSKTDCVDNDDVIHVSLCRGI